MKRPSATSWVRRTFTWYLTAKAVLAILVIAVSAASITASTMNYQAEFGSAYNAKNNILLGDKGFSKPTVGTAATASCPSAVTFGPIPGGANNNITAGHIVFDVQVNSTGTTPTLKCFIVTLTLTLTGSQTIKTLAIASGVSVADGWTIDCKLDTAMTSLPMSPFSFTVIVQ